MFLKEVVHYRFQQLLKTILRIKKGCFFKGILCLLLKGFPALKTIRYDVLKAVLIYLIMTHFP